MRTRALRTATAHALPTFAGWPLHVASRTSDAHCGGSRTRSTTLRTTRSGSESASPPLRSSSSSLRLRVERFESGSVERYGVRHGFLDALLGTLLLRLR